MKKRLILSQRFIFRNYRNLMNFQLFDEIE